MLPSSPLLAPLIVTCIGIGIGLAFNRYAGTWLSRLGRTNRSDMTSALVGIAGAFIGFHLAAAAGSGLGQFFLFVAAALGAAIVVWVWRGR